MSQRFSGRHGYKLPDAEITVRHQAPDDLRAVVIEIAYESGINPKRMRQLVCRILRVAPNPSNWSDYPNIDDEVRDLLRECEWYFVYDVIEDVYSTLSTGNLVSISQCGSLNGAQYFSEEINRYFRGVGIGWQLVAGQIEVRGSETFEDAIHGAHDALKSTGRVTAATELHEAIDDLSRRPEPDITGAIQHALAALECVARDAADSKLTLGEIINRHPELIPKPLDKALEKVWGYASETGRHLKEGKSPKFEEAELMVGLSGILCRYFVRKFEKKLQP